MRRRFALLLSALILPAAGHEVRPAYLQITENHDHGYEVLWKRPAVGEQAVHLVPHLSGGSLEESPWTVVSTESFLTSTWKIPSGKPSLNGQTVSIEGLQDTITDTLVVVRAADKSAWQTILTPAHPAQTLDLGSDTPGAPTAFLGLGIEHILTGVDHLLFVFGLLLIVSNRWMLLKTVTAFTVAHSITLAAATLGYVHPPVEFVNAAIALSILFLGAEIVRRRRGGTSLTIRYPWVVAFLFGLLHGFGFSSGLNAAGLPQHAIPAALLLFNVGVEVGQLSFVVLILWLERAFRVLQIRWARPLQILPGYAVGTLGALWTLQRFDVLLGGGGS
jgi:hydrogenase/urease accessory protein HupE